MAAKVVQLRTRRDLLGQEQATELRQRMLELKEEMGLPEQASAQIIAAIDQQTATSNRSPFVMISPTDNAKVVAWLLANSKLPQKAALLWSHLFPHLRWDTGEIMRTREELAETIQASVQDVSRIMTELESIHAVSRRREKVAGMRGPGVVRYFMNPRIGTHLGGQRREKAQTEAPLLRLVEKSS